MLDIHKLKKIASGGQAEIYELDPGKILRLMYNKEDMFLSEYEFKSMQTVMKHGLPVPAVYDMITLDDRPGLIMEKIAGITMTEHFVRKPLNFLDDIKKLADLQYNLSGITAPEELMKLKQRIRHLVGKSTELDHQKKDFIFRLLEELPDGNQLCHGDFHPNNILIRQGRFYIIDWSGVTSGDPVADVAHSYLIFRNMPRLPQESYPAYIGHRLAGNLLSKVYLNRFNRQYSIDFNMFSRWLAVRAGERTFYGTRSEKPALVRFVDRCFSDYGHQKEHLNWIRFL